jgi:hypothetical protein
MMTALLITRYSVELVKDLYSAKSSGRRWLNRVVTTIASGITCEPLRKRVKSTIRLPILKELMTIWLGGIARSAAMPDRRDWITRVWFI